MAALRRDCFLNRIELRREAFTPSYLNSLVWSLMKQIFNTGASMQIQSLTTRGVLVPLTFTLGTSAAIVRTVPLLLVDIVTEAGVTGRAYIFCYRPSGARAIADHLAEAFGLLKGRDVMPLDAMQTLSRQFSLLGVTGAVRMALSVLDMAMWDATAHALQLPLASLLGGRPKPVLAYDSRGLGLMKSDSLAKETEALLERGLKAVKLRLGYPTLSEDMVALKAVRDRASDDIAIMVDYNQALTGSEAVARGRELEKEGIYWLEEPIPHDDYEALAIISRELRVPVQIGENFNGPQDMLRALSARASDFIMPDVARIGGVTGWMQAAGVATAHQIEMSSHLMPEISAQLLCATPTAHWLEYVDWADAILLNPLQIVDGKVLTSDMPGSGILWDEAKLKRLETI